MFFAIIYTDDSEPKYAEAVKGKNSITNTINNNCAYKSFAKFSLPQYSPLIIFYHKKAKLYINFIQFILPLFCPSLQVLYNLKLFEPF